MLACRFATPAHFPCVHAPRFSNSHDVLTSYVLTCARSRRDAQDHPRPSMAPQKACQSDRFSVRMLHPCAPKAQPGAVSTIMAPRHLPNPPSRLLLAVGRSAQDRPGPRSTLPETGVHQNESSAEGRPEAPRTDFPQYGVACGDPRLQMNARTALFSSSGFLFAPFASRRGGSSTLRAPLLHSEFRVPHSAFLHARPPTRNSGPCAPHSSAFSPSGGAPNIAQYRPVSPSRVPQTALFESKCSAEYRPVSPNIGFSVYGTSTCTELADTPPDNAQRTTNNGQSPHAGTHPSPLPSHLRTFTFSHRMASEPAWTALDHV